MKKIVFCGLLCCLCAGLNAQQLISSTFLGSKTKNQLLAQFNIPFIGFGVNYYQITYTTPDVHGITDTVSGLLVVPDDPTGVYPRLVYQHGTSGSPQDVPSFNVQNGGEGIIGWLFGGLGFVSLLPDYLGLGVSTGVHPYVHAASEASTAVDMLRAASIFEAQQGFNTHDQLFVTGYSQGGHAGMALHRAIQTNLSNEFEVTAAAHLSGPYSISGVMRDLILGNQVYYYPAYLPNTAVSYQEVYGNLYNQLSDIFRAPYAGLIQQFQDGVLELGDLNEQLIAALIANEGASITTKMLQPAVITAVTNDPQHPINLALADNDVYQ